MRLLVPKNLLTQTLSQLFEQLQPSDLSVQEPPIEAVMGKLLRDGKVEPITPQSTPPTADAPRV